MMGQIELGELLRKRRHELQLTLKEVGAMVGRTHAHLSRVERGDLGVSLHTLRRIAAAYSIPLQQLEAIYYDTPCLAVCTLSPICHMRSR